MPTKTFGYAADSLGAELKPWTFERRDLRDEDVQIDILYCGICHSDIHQVNNDWGISRFPMVPGHEIVGKIREIGPKVSKFKKGDTVAVGCMVDSCLSCKHCRRGEEQYCVEGNIQSYNGTDRIDGSNTYGGYSDNIVVREEFVVRVPENLDLSRVPPILCAGITTYSPLRHFNAGPGKKVAVTGLGGLGHMAVKLAVGLGADVTVISRNEDKRQTALEMGADHYVASSNEEEYKKLEGTFDIIIDTIPVKHDVSQYLPLLEVDGAVVVVGHLGAVPEYNNLSTVTKRHIITGSLIGGIAETQELMDFCGRKNILPDCEIVKMDEINKAYARLEKGDVKYRFCIDMSTLPKA